MTKDDKIKICRAFMQGWTYGRISLDRILGMQEFIGILRWGLKHPEELRKGK